MDQLAHFTTGEYCHPHGMRASSFVDGILPGRLSHNVGMPYVNHQL